MKVKKIMRSPVISCSGDTNLAEAVHLLWSTDCGVLPVVDTAGKVVGIITDRDICVAAGSRNRAPADILVKQVASHEVVVCKPEDDVLSALEAMKDKQVRRLPVVDEAGALKGILSVNDIVRCAEPVVTGKASELSYNDVMPVLKAISERGPIPQARLAAA